MSFELAASLQKDTFPIAKLKLSHLSLMNDARFPWLILVPERNNITEIYQLISADQQQLLTEISDISKIFQNLTKAKKMNIAMLGNQVSQLHVHIIARFSQDEAWPNPVWGQGTPLPYSAGKRDEMIASILPMLSHFGEDL